MTKPPTMPDIRILTRSISEEWEDLLLGAYTDPERVENRPPALSGRRRRARPLAGTAR